MSLSNTSRETKVISAILFATLLSLVGARYLDRQGFVDWSDVEKIAEYDREAGIGDSIEIRYYLVNDRPYVIKVKPELTYYYAIYYSSRARASSLKKNSLQNRLSKRRDSRRLLRGPLKPRTVSRILRMF